MKHFGSILRVWTILCMTAPAIADQFFVSTAGNDDASGRENQPFETITRGIRDLGPNDTLTVLAGEYHEHFALSALKATRSKPLILQARQNHRVILNLHEQRPSGIRINNCTHVILRGFEVIGATDGPGIQLQNCDHCTIAGNVVAAGTSVGIRLTASHDNLLSGNICYHNDTGIYIGAGSTRNVIEGNICAFGNHSSENADGIGSSDCENNEYRFNVLVGNNDDGLDMWTSKKNLIEWNFACANGDQLDGDGNGFKLGGKWQHRAKNDPWNGGEHTVRHNLSVWNLSTGFTDNGSSGNTYESNVAFGNRNTGPYASVKHTDTAGAEQIRIRIRKHFAELIEANVIRPQVNPLPVGVGLIRELRIWPADLPILQKEQD